MKKELKKVFSNLWQLPQNIMGWIASRFYKGEILGQRCGSIKIYPNKHGDQNDFIIIDTTRTKIKVSNKIKGGIALGEYIIVNDPYKQIKNGVDQLDRKIAHEYGHTIDSRKFGPLYLIIIGLPSVIWITSRKMFKRLKDKDYFSFYTEKRADKNGNIKRDKK